MGDELKYNGWTNYNTWSIALWLNNDEQTQSFYIEEAKRIKANPKYIEIKDTKILRDPIVRLADFIKKSVLKCNPLTRREQCPNLYVDVLTHGLAHVNYREIAKSFMEGL